MIRVSEELPETIKAKMLKKLMEKLSKRSLEKSIEYENPEKIVWTKLADDKAKELMHKAKQLYPRAYPYVIDIFYRLLKQGVIKEFDGYTTYVLLHRIGVPVKPDLRIKFIKHGKEVDFKEYIGG